MKDSVEGQAEQGHGSKIGARGRLYGICGQGMVVCGGQSSSPDEHCAQALELRTPQLRLPARKGECPLFAQHVSC